jgi:cysteine desulfurase
MKFPIYLDNQATTPLDPRVREAMDPYLTTRFGNPHSVTHRFGWEGAEAIEVARGKIAALVNAAADEIVFTSGATETNNLVIKGLAESYRGARCEIVTLATEHACVLESCAHAEKWGAKIVLAPVGPDGLVNLPGLEKLLNENTRLVSVMAVNNEIGVLQPLAEIGALCKARGILFHSDAAQALGKVPLDVQAMNVDYLSLSGHKIYGPKGVGALFARKDALRKLTPQMDGGGQERGVRSGTLSPALCVGFGRAAEIAKVEMKAEAARTDKMAKAFLATLKKAIPDVRLNGSAAHRWWGNLNLTFPGIDGERLISALKKVAVSSGAACASATEGPSYVLQALGVSDEDARSTLRIGFGRFTTEDEAAFAADYIAAEIKNLKSD